MTDITRFKNVSLSKKTYSEVGTLSKEVFGVPISLSKTIESSKVEEADKADKESKESKESEESSEESFEMARLEDSDSSGGGQGVSNLQRGGYNVNRYYLSRLNYDKFYFLEH